MRGGEERQSAALRTLRPILSILADATTPLADWATHSSSVRLLASIIHLSMLLGCIIIVVVALVIPVGILNNRL